LIHQAYIVFATGEFSPRLPSPPLSGGPDWLDSETFDIEATADGEPSGEMIRGPVMQTLLEHKMKLKVHRENGGSPAYASGVSDGTPRLQPFQEGNCTRDDLSKSLRPVPGVNHCSFFVGQSPMVGPRPTAEAKSATLKDFTKLLSLAVDRPVTDATGIPGLQPQYGLKLVPSRAPQEFLVVDHVEKPTAN
jgi:uncharacterized protein (TIGR03435 family)